MFEPQGLQTELWQAEVRSILVDGFLNKSYLIQTIDWSKRRRLLSIWGPLIFQFHSKFDRIFVNFSSHFRFFGTRRKRIDINLTGWANIKDGAETGDNSYHISYSSHSNFREIEMFVASVKPAILKPVARGKKTLNNLDGVPTHFHQLKYNLMQLQQRGLPFLETRYADIMTASDEYLAYACEEAKQIELLKRLGVTMNCFKKSKKSSNATKRGRKGAKLSKDVQMVTNLTGGDDGVENESNDEIGQGSDFSTRNGALEVLDAAGQGLNSVRKSRFPGSGLHKELTKYTKSGRSSLKRSKPFPIEDPELKEKPKQLKKFKANPKDDLLEDERPRLGVRTRSRSKRKDFL